MNKLIFFMGAIALLTTFACKERKAATGRSGVISFESEKLFPEGIEFDAAKNVFLVTSLGKGIVSTVTLDGKISTLVDDKDLISAIGIRIDGEKNRFYVCSSDPGVSVKTATKSQKKLAGLGVYDLATGQKIKFLDLGALAKGGNHFCNDIALAEDGSIFVTDSFAPIIYKVTPDLEPAIHTNDKRFSAAGFGLNGIVALSDGSIVVTVSESGKLYKIDGQDGMKISEIQSAKTYPNADGLTLIGGKTLAIMQNADRTVNFVDSADSFKSITETKSVNLPEYDYLTTGIVANGKLYVLNAKLSLLFGGKADAVTKFDIIEVAR